jgi:hypothetical protein
MISAASSSAAWETRAGSAPHRAAREHLLRDERQQAETHVRGDALGARDAALGELRGEGRRARRGGPRLCALRRRLERLERRVPHERGAQLALVGRLAGQRRQLESAVVRAEVPQQLALLLGERRVLRRGARAERGARRVLLGERRVLRRGAAAAAVHRDERRLDRDGAEVVGRRLEHGLERRAARRHHRPRAACERHRLGHRTQVGRDVLGR